MSNEQAPRESEDGPAIGTLIAGKYRVERVLGAGGMGVVVAATHEVLGELVAIKFLKATDKRERVARFLREARAAARIRSEHVARVHDVGEADDGSPYIVMEYLEGEDLGDRLKRLGSLPVEEAVDYVLHACEAVANAHALGIVHRDLKPSNLFYTCRTDGSPVVKVIDFGISKMLQEDTSADEAAGGITRSWTILGSPLYMSPEQMLSARDVDARCDVWALGGILYALLTGEPPFRGHTVAAIYEAILRGPPALRERLPDAPVELERAVQSALQKDPDARCPDVAAFAMALSPFASEEARVSVGRVQRLIFGRGDASDGHRASLVGPVSGGTPPGDLSLSASRPSARGIDAEAVTSVSSASGALRRAGSTGELASVSAGATNASWAGDGPPLRRMRLRVVAGVLVLGALAVVAWLALRPHGADVGVASSSAAGQVAASGPPVATEPQPGELPASAGQESPSSSTTSSSPSAGSAAASTRAAPSVVRPPTTPANPPPVVPPPATTTTTKPPPPPPKATDPFASPR